MRHAIIVLRVLLLGVLVLLSTSPAGMVSAGPALWSSSSSNGARPQANTWHVSTAGSDSTGDGSATQPFATIQHGIDVASDGDIVLVQPGVYRENINFTGKNITVASLFDTTGNRDYILQTVIDGQRSGSVVLFVSGETAAARLSGFTITNGYASNTPPSGSNGGGIYCVSASPTLTDLRVIGNEASGEGGGMYLSNCAPAIRDVAITNNEAGTGGGGIRYSGGSVNLENVVVSHNSALTGGSGIFLYHANGAVTNALIADNTGSGKGGGLVFDASSPTFFNVTIVGNRTTDQGSGMNVSYMSQPTLVNSIVWGNASAQIYFDTDWPGEAITIAYSDIEGGQAGIVTNGQGPVNWGDGNLDTSPRFVHAGLGNYRLANASPAIDAGSNAAVPAGVTTDLDGGRRISGGVVDLGAYEYQSQYQRWYVNDDGAAGNGCTSWTDACPDLQTALGQAASGDEIWVAAGTYTPTYESTPGDPRSATFQLKNGVALYGGFDPTVGDTGWEDRDWVSNATVLSGDIGTAGDPSDNSYHVFYHPGELALDGSAVLDGFTVSGGNANGADWPYTHGGGMYNSDSSSPVVTNCTFSGNSAGNGGGMLNWYSWPVVTNCAFSGNSATTSGGGIHNDTASNPTLTNVTLSGNSATSYGGGIYNHASSPTLANSILSGNTAGSGGAQIYEAGASPVSVTYSDIQGGWSGTGNIDADPLFVDADGADNIAGTADDNLRLQPGSPAIDAGSNAAVPAGVTTDLGGKPRIVNGTVDMGAYEYQGVTASPSGNNALLTFEYAGAGISYQVWCSSSPYFTPVDEGTNLGDICTNDGVTVTCTHENAIGDPSVNSFYVVRATRANGTYADSNRTAVFGFALAPGD